MQVLVRAFQYGMIARWGSDDSSFIIHYPSGNEDSPFLDAVVSTRQVSA